MVFWDGLRGIPLSSALKCVSLGFFSFTRRSRGSPSCSRKVSAAQDRDKWSLSLGMDDWAKFGFFDLHQNQLDCVPNTMVQHDGKVLLAGGHGNLNESFATDICSISRFTWPLRPCVA